MAPSTNRRDARSDTNGRWLSADLLRQFDAERTDAFRLFSNANGWVERFGSDALISYKSAHAHDTLFAGLEQWEREHGCAFERIFARLLAERNEQRAPPRLVRGGAGRPLGGVAHENGVAFALDFSAGYSVGFFIDQRANRAFLRQCGARRVLNTFAYTCSFSVMAALSGATTVSVDLSRKSLTRGEENFRRNGLDPAGHRFLHDDVLALLPRLERRGERFDAIILDPPTFSRGEKGRRFQVERDFEDLLVAALGLAEPRARILLSTNCTRLAESTLQQIARYALKGTRRSATFHREPALPDIPPEFAAQTLWMFTTR